MHTDKYLNWQVEPNLFPMLASWKRESTMEDILLQLKKEMMSPQNRKLSQPPEGVILISDCYNLLVFL